MLSLADVAIVGHLEDSLLIGAVAVGSTVFNILYWLFAFLRMSTSGLTAQAFGAGNKNECSLVLSRSLATALAGALIVLVLAFVAGKSVIGFVDGSGDVSLPAWKYFRLAILGAPGVLLTFVVSGWLLGMQRSRPIMWIALATNLLNIALSVTLVYGFELGLTGVALGTAVSQLTGACIGLFVVRRVFTSTIGSFRKKLLQIKTDFWEKGRWGEIFKLNTDIFLRTACLAAVTLWFTHSGAAMGSEILTANALLMQLFMVFSYFMDGFAFGGEALAGRYFGAGRMDLLNKTVVNLFKWGIATSLVFTALYFLAGDVFLGFLTDDSGALSVAKDYILWAVTVPLAGFSAFTWDGIMIGLTRSRYLLVSMSVSMAVFFAVFYAGVLSFPSNAALNHILWLAFILYLVSRGIILTALYRRFLRQHSPTPRK